MKPNNFAVTSFILYDSRQVAPDDISIDKPFVFDGVMLCTCVKGNARYRLNYRELAIREKQVLIVIPGQIICMLEQSEDFLCELLFFPLNFLDDYPSSGNYDILLRLNENPCFTLPPEIMSSILELHSLIIKHHQSGNHSLQKDIVKSLVFSLLLIVFSVYETGGKLSPAKSRQEMLTEEFFKLLFEHHKQERSVAFYADKLCLTPKYLSTTIRKVTGHPILLWINEIMIISIKNHLRMTNTSVSQIAEEFNFSDSSFFGRYFKNYVGITPLQYRKEAWSGNP